MDLMKYLLDGVAQAEPRREIKRRFWSKNNYEESMSEMKDTRTRRG